MQSPARPMPRIVAVQEDELYRRWVFSPFFREAGLRRLPFGRCVSPPWQAAPPAAELSRTGRLGGFSLILELPTAAFVQDERHSKSFPGYNCVGGLRGRPRPSFPAGCPPSDWKPGCHSREMVLANFLDRQSAFVPPPSSEPASPPFIRSLFLDGFYQRENTVEP